VNHLFSHSRVGSKLQPKTLDYGEKTFQGQTLQLLMNNGKLRRKKFL